jgi:NAD(P)-dependent dehydrogenase (short-subunit alcohol dehydrogenase family)
MSSETALFLSAAGIITDPRGKGRCSPLAPHIRARPRSIGRVGVLATPRASTAHPIVPVSATVARDCAALVTYGLDMTSTTSPLGRLAGRKVLITGGTSGLGAATAFRFACEGATVVLASRRETEPDSVGVIDRINAIGGTATFVAMNVLDDDEMSEAVSAATAFMGGLDTLVASAGVATHPQHVGRHSSLLHLAPDHFDYVLDVNLRGVFRTIQLGAQIMVANQQPGAIVTLASMASKRPSAGAYSVSKAAVWMLTRCFAEELGPHGIRVNAIGPGYVETELFDSMVRAGAGPDPVAQQAFREDRRTKLSLGEYPSAEDVAQTALFLCSDAGRMLTGSILHPDGGYTSTFGGG